MGQYGKPEELTIYVTPQIPMKNRRSRITLGITKIEHYNIEPGKIYKITLEDPETKKKYTYYFKTPKEIINKIYIGTPTLKPHKHYRIVEIIPFEVQDYLDILNHKTQEENIGLGFILQGSFLYIKRGKNYYKVDKWKYDYKKGGIPYIELKFEAGNSFRVSIENGKIIFRRYTHTKKKSRNRTGRIVYEKATNRYIHTVLDKLIPVKIQHKIETVNIEKLSSKSVEKVVITFNLIKSILNCAEFEIYSTTKEENREIYLFRLKGLGERDKDLIIRYYEKHYKQRNNNYIEKIGFILAKRFLKNKNYKFISSHPFTTDNVHGPDLLASDDDILLCELKFRTGRKVGYIIYEGWRDIRKHAYISYKEETVKNNVKTIGVIYVNMKIRRKKMKGKIIVEREDYIDP